MRGFKYKVGDKVRFVGTYDSTSYVYGEEYTVTGLAVTTRSYYLNNRATNVSEVHLVPVPNPSFDNLRKEIEALRSAGWVVKFTASRVEEVVL